MKTVLAYSGGLDSTVLLYKLLSEGHQVECLFFDYGSKHQKKELKSAESICKSLDVSLKIVSLGFIDELFNSNLLKSGGSIPQGHHSDASMKKTVVPGRNSIFGAIMIGYAESVKADSIALANHAGDHSTYPDTRPEWVAALSLLAHTASEGKVKVLAPFSNMDKTAIVRKGFELKAPFEKTWTCYSGQQKPCGKCGSCSGRAEAFLTLEKLDPLT